MLDGLTVEESDFAFVCRIETLSEELQNEIRERLSSICHGQDNATTKQITYTYKETLKEFLKRYNKKTEKIKKGMIGELLTHLLVTKIIPSTESVNPFFNLEESSIKKGFDLILFDNSHQGMLITEVKSSEAGNKNADTVNKNLLNIAKNDLKLRLNGDETHIWMNAINGAKVALSKGKIKDKINEILQNCYAKASSDNQDSKIYDVILVAVVYKSLEDSITLGATEDKKNIIEGENLFNRVFALSIQKETYQKVADFIEKEAVE